MADPSLNFRYATAGQRVPTAGFEDRSGWKRDARSRRNSTTCRGTKVDGDEHPREWFDAREPEVVEEHEDDCFPEEYRDAR
ncbi:unnamed protein product [Urochloa humidicola]